jgi:hypothetical protein
MDDINFFELELYPILNELKGIVLDSNKIKDKYNLENIDSYIISEDAHIFIKYKWEDKGISKKALESYGKPLREWNNFTPCFTSETLINNIVAYVAYPALGIEESVDTNLQVSIFGKKDYWGRYGYENFF